MPQRLVDPAPADDILEVHALVKAFRSRGGARASGGIVRAVDDVSLRLPRRHTMAMVGESGCGKTTLARNVAHLYRPDSGKIVLLGREVQHLSDSAFRPLRKHVQMVFQNPAASFDPLRSIGYSIAETARLRTDGPRDMETRVAELLTEVGLGPAFARLKPRQMSGGEQQRAAIARALAPRPELVVMDEPTSALDMSIQGQVLQLMRDLKERYGLSYLVATHDLRSVRLIADSVIVLYLGQIVEQGPTEVVLETPAHPYTRGLLYAHDLAGRTPQKDTEIGIRGTLRYPEPAYKGCRLVGRCPLEKPRCREPQGLTSLAPDHSVRCWRVVEGDVSP